MTHDEMTALMARCVAAFQRRDAAALADEHADDCIMDSPTAGGIVEGRDAIRRIYNAWFKAFPDLQINAEPPIIDGDRVAQCYLLTGTDTGGFLGMAPSGKPFRLPLVWVCDVENGAIAHSRPIYDFSGMLIQLGVLKVKSS